MVSSVLVERFSWGCPWSSDSKVHQYNAPMVHYVSLSPYIGTNSAKARQILDESGLPIQGASDLADAANKVVASLKS